MSIHRYAARTDANKTAIVAALRAAGCSVFDLRQPVDLLVGRGGRTLLVEIKDGKKPPSQRKHTPAQKAFLAEWLGGTVATVDGVEAALRAVRVMDMDRRTQALQAIVDLDPSKDSEEGFNEWGEAECFRLAQDIAGAALRLSDVADSAVTK